MSSPVGRTDPPAEREQGGSAGLDRPIRVLVAGPHPPPTGGIATVVQNIMRMDFGGEIEVRLFETRSFPRPSGSVFRLINALSARIPPAGFWTLITRWLVRSFVEALDRENPDLVHVHASHGYGYWAGTSLVREARKRGIPAIIHTHGSDMDLFYAALSPASRTLYRRGLDRAELVVTLSESWKRWFERLVPASRIAVIANCIDWQRYQRGNPGRDSGRLRILFVGLMEARRKGVHDLIAELPRVLDAFPGVELVLIGPDSEGVEAGLQVDARTRAALEFVGELDPEGIADAYAEATLFVLPAYSEGMPMVMLEAMAAGLPVLCTAVNAIPEVVEDGVNGVLIQPGDRDSLADSLIALLGDPSLRVRYGEAARKTTQEKHNVARQTEWLRELYLRGAARTRGRR